MFLSPFSCSEIFWELKVDEVMLVVVGGDFERDPVPNRERAASKGHQRSILP